MLIFFIFDLDAKRFRVILVKVFTAQIKLN